MRALAVLSAADVIEVLINVDGDIVRLTDLPRKAGDVDLFLSLHHDSMQVLFLANWNRDGTETPYGDRYAGHSLFVSRESHV